MKIASLSSPIWDGKENHLPGVPFEINDAAGQQLIDAKKAQEVKVVIQEVVVPVVTDESDTTEPVVCPECSKEYKSQKALDFHTAAKHPKE